MKAQLRDKFDPLDKVIEECAEVIHAIQKIKIYGWLSYNPTLPPNKQIANREQLGSKLDDLEYQIARLRKEYML